MAEDDEPEDPDPIAAALASARALPAAAVTALFHRYGRPLEVAPPPAAPDEPKLALTLDDGSTATLRALRLRTPVDVIANDWFVLERAGGEPLAIAGPLFAAALAALARAVAKRR
jgi:hypothetical protein